MSGTQAILARIRAELADLEQIVQRVEHLFAKAQMQDDDDYLDGVALNLHGYYTGVERIFQEIAREVDGSVPDGPDWHRNLMMQMSAEVAHTRPVVLQYSTRICLEEYRGFRHVVRNVYTFNLRPSRLRELVFGLRACYMALVQDITDFSAFLEQLDPDS